VRTGVAVLRCSRRRGHVASGEMKRTGSVCMVPTFSAQRAEEQGTWRQSAGGGMYGGERERSEAKPYSISPPITGGFRIGTACVLLTYG